MGGEIISIFNTEKIVECDIFFIILCDKYIFYTLVFLCNSENLAKMNSNRFKTHNINRLCTEF